MRDPRGVHDARRFVELGPAGQQGVAVGQGPAVILHVRHLDPPGAPVQGEADQRFEVVQVLPMDHGVERQRQPRRHDQRGCGPLARLGAAQAADPLGARLFGVLHRELHVVEAGGAQPIQQAASSSTPAVMRLV
jgi:hypothetical protein